MTGARERFTVHLTCPQCQQVGWIVWEENDASHRRRGAERSFVDAFGFHPEGGRTKSGDPVIVCDACDEIQPD